MQHTLPSVAGELAKICHFFLDVIFKVLYSICPFLMWVSVGGTAI
jgi:hypothetical protein